MTPLTTVVQHQEACERLIAREASMRKRAALVLLGFTAMSVILILVQYAGQGHSGSLTVFPGSILTETTFLLVGISFALRFWQTAVHKFAFISLIASILALANLIIGIGNAPEAEKSLFGVIARQCYFGAVIGGATILHALHDRREVALALAKKRLPPNFSESPR